MRQLAEGASRPAIRLFGPLEIEDGERTLGPRDLGGTRPKQVLEILVGARGHLVSFDRLAELLWGAEPPRNAAGSLQTFVSVLRRRLVDDPRRARDLVVTGSEAYRFATDRVQLDLDRFDELVARSSHEPTRRARASLEEALGLVRGEVLEDEPYATWTVDLRGSYRGRVLGARLDAAEAALAERDPAPALAHAEEAAGLDGYSERACRLEMLSLYALDRTHEALTSYRAFRQRLDEQLGLEPAAETRALEAAILRREHVETLLPRSVRRAAVGADPRPLRLLGRTRELDALVDGVSAGVAGNVVLVSVDGEPGLGKTRLLDELAGRLDGLGLRVGRASGVALAQHLPYVTLATALREALPGVQIDAGRFPGVGAILPELSIGAPGVGYDELTVLEAFVGLVRAHGPLVLLIDDFHLTDAQTLTALSYLRRRGGTLRAAVVVAGRWRDRRLTPDLALSLEPLSPADLASLALPDLHEATGGHPAYVVEALTRGQSAGVSQTLSEAVLAQCRAEGEWGHRVLATASTLEQPFSPEPLARLLGADDAELAEELERLCERRLLRIDGLGFRFRYDVVREVLLETVSPARRHLLHRRLDPAVAP